MQRKNILRTLLFIVFFSIGATAMYLSIICDELLQSYDLKQQLKAEKELRNRLESLTVDYDAVLENLQKDPNLLQRIAPATLGTEREDEQTIYPKVTPEQLNAARKALSKEPDQQFPEPAVPDWITRCSRPPRRIVLFLAGASLILISFVFFVPARQRSREE